MNDFNDTNKPKKVLKKKKRPLKKVPKKSHNNSPKQYQPQREDNNVPSFTEQTPKASPFNEPQQYQEPRHQQHIPQPNYDAAPHNQYQDNFARDLNLPASVISTKAMVLLFIVLFLAGLMIGKATFSKSGGKAGLQGVISNPEVPNGRPRCGLAEKTQGCVLYIMNPERQELEAREFYDLVSQLTGRQRFVIETGNMRYANDRIKPGRIGQFNVPPLQ